MFLLALHPFVSAQEDNHSVVFGDLQIKATAVKVASGDELKQYSLHPQAGNKIVLVAMEYKDVSTFPSCSRNDIWLVVEQGFRYRATRSGTVKPPSEDLKPAEVSTGSLAFEVKEGTTPASLTMVRNRFGEAYCTGSQHREKVSSSPASASLSLAGLPFNPE